MQNRGQTREMCKDRNKKGMTMRQEGELEESETKKSNLEEWEDTGLY